MEPASRGLKEERCLRAESAPQPESCAGRTEEDENVEETSQRAACVAGSGRCPDLCLIPEPVLLNISFTWTHLDSFINTVTVFSPSRILVNLVKFCTCDVA